MNREGGSLTLGQGVGGVAPSLSAPTLAVLSPVTNPPLFTTALVLPLVGDIIALQIASDAGFSSILFSDTNTLDGGEVAALDADFATTPLTSGATCYARARHTRGAIVSLWSNTVTFAIPKDAWTLEDASGHWQLEDASGNWILEIA